jgi:hypothetical protein
MPVLVEMLWRVLGPSNKPIVCGIYRDGAGLEVRCHYEESIDALIRSERASHIDTARDLAEQWREATVAKGFTELSGEDRSDQKR